MKDYIYMDYASSTYVKKQVLDKMEPYNSILYANPSSIYKLGRESKKAIYNSSENIASVINCDAEDIIFTSGGSESDNLAIKGIAYQYINKGNHIITTKIEHPAVFNLCKSLEKDGFKITYLDVDKDGFIDTNELIEAISDKTILISIMFANNEIGTIQPIKEIGEICKQRNVIFHCDAVQAIGSIPIDVKDLKIDLLSISSHKIYGPKGVGALYLNKNIKIKPEILGGAQQRGKRAGTENVPAIVGFGYAIKFASKNIAKESIRLINLRDIFINGLLEIPGTKLNGSINNRLPNNINISFGNFENETILMMLDNKDIYASGGSACQAGALEPSRVLTSIGLSKDQAKSSIRFTIGANTKEEDIYYVINSMKEIIQTIKNIEENWNKGCD
ncbi:MAG: cysteine desulfurase family protein [Clostridiaceae bacterium]